MLAEAAAAPLSVILQVTKRCNFDCSFCSETLQLPDPTLIELYTIRAYLAGVRRVFLSGGEPLLRKDFGEIVDLYTGDFVLSIPTNATRGLRHAKSMAGKVAFVNVGLEGPRSTTNRVRGDYDEVMAGIRASLDHGLPLSLSAVVRRSTLHALPFTFHRQYTTSRAANAAVAVKGLLDAIRHIHPSSRWSAYRTAASRH
jgi:molybdenum cofactor biosynthesis enzyme MoaA